MTNGTKSAPNAHFVRFNDEWNDRLKKAARERGVPITTVLREGAQLIIERIEDEAGVRKTKREAAVAERKGRAPVSGGLGLSFKRDEKPDAAPVAEQPVVVVATQAAPAPMPAANEVDRLARYVVTGPEWNRADRLKTAADIITASTASAEERNRLAQQLDEKIGEILAKPQSDTSPFSWLRKALS